MWRSRFPAFESADYRRLFLNTFFASASNWALLLGRGWLVFEMTHSSTAVGLVTFAGWVPFFFAGPIGGAVADTFDRRRVALGAAFVAIFTSVLLAGLTFAGAIEVWHVVALALLAGSARAFATPAEDAMTPNAVPREHLVNAVSLSGISRHGSRLLGPLLGAVLLTTLGAGWVFLLSAVLLVGSVAQLGALRLRSAPPADAAEHESGLTLVRSLWHSIGEGFAYVERDRRVATVIAFVVFHCTLTMAFDSMMPRLAADIGGGSRTFGAISIGLGLGSILGTLSLSLLRHQIALGPVLLLTGLGSGLAMVLFALTTTPEAAIVATILVGSAQATYMALTAVFVQQVVPDEMRGRVMSIYSMLAGGDMALANFGFGWLSDLVGVRPLLIVPGLLWVAILLAGIAFVPELRHLVRRGTFRPQTAVSVVAIEGQRTS